MFNVNSKGQTLTVKSNTQRKDLINQMIEKGEHLKLINQLFCMQSDEFENILIQLFQQKFPKQINSKLYKAIKKGTIHKDQFTKEYENCLDRSLFSFLILLDLI